MKKKYGIPYMGSKSSILPKVCKLFPNAENFYDLFGGGFSITHFMIENRGKDFKNFYFNEIKKGIPDLIKDAISGKYNYKNFSPEFIDRDTFFKEIEKDNQYVKTIWSFGNNGRDYLFSKEIENYKKSMHNAIVFNQFDELAEKVLGMSKFSEGYSITDKRLFLRNKVEYYRKNGIPEFLKVFLSEKQLEQLQQLERLEQLQQLEFYNTDYRKVPIKDNSIIYCDIPYRGTAEYDKNNSFNHQEFYEWAASQNNPVFISEYNLPDDRFKAIARFKKRSLLSQASKENTLVKIEKVFTNKVGYKAFVDYCRKKRSMI